METTLIHRPIVAIAGLAVGAALLSACGDAPPDRVAQDAALVQAEARHERSVSAQSDRLTAQALAHGLRPGASERSLSAQADRLTAQAEAHGASPADPGSAALVDDR